MRTRRSTTGLRYGLLTLFAIAWVGVPIWLVVVNSFKTAGEAASLNLALPSTWAAGENYSTAIVDGDYFHALLNSLIVAVPTIIVIVLVGAAAAWAFGRSCSRMLQIVFYVVTLSILIPPSLIPTIFLLRDMGLRGTMVGYILVLVGTRMGILVFLATGFVRNMPVDLEQAAAIDGANSFQVFQKVVLPLLSPVLFVGSIILFIGIWSDFFFATFLIPGGGAADTSARSLFLRDELGEQLPLEPRVRTRDLGLHPAAPGVCFPAEARDRGTHRGRLEGLAKRGSGRARSVTAPKPAQPTLDG